jgi:hypothetical protein
MALTMSVTRWEGCPSAGGVCLEALNTALTQVYSDNLVVPQALHAGDLLLIDASRVLWGQAPLSASPGWQSTYECGFISLDDARSRARVLRRLMPHAKENKQ